MAARLGLAGVAGRDAFFALCENTHPHTGASLTPRQREDRTTGYDINFHAPKSVSVLHSFAGDDHILQAFRASVQETMQAIEADSQTRVRKGGKMLDRATGELIWAHFVHQTARPVEGALPDPHLHAHCFVFNATWDANENRIKAAQFRDIKRDMPYYQAMFHKLLADRLIAAGYAIQRSEKSFEVVGVPQKVIGLFSKRTDEIGRIAKEQGITDAKEKSELGARTRAKKQKGHSMDELRAAWHEQIAALGDEGKGDAIVRYAPDRDMQKVTAKDCITHAVKHGFERASVLDERRLLAQAMRFALGRRGATIKNIAAELASDAHILRLKERGRTMCTTKSVLAEEQHMVALARAGMGVMRPLYAASPATVLKDQQAAAVVHVLTTSHRVSIIRGAAGTGKTTLMQEAVKHIAAAGKTVTVVAPTAQAARGVLRDEGFAHAETVAKLLTDQAMQQKLKGQVLWVDEAGLLGTKDMTALLKIATEQNARLILGGDTRQHASVVRGDALRILNTVAGITSAEVSKIYRQKKKDYKEAVESLAKGNVQDGFAKLDAAGFITEIDAVYGRAKMVADYVAAMKDGKSVLMISPTHAQGEDATATIRQQLREAKLLGKKEITAQKLVNLNLTEAERSDQRQYQQGQIVQFEQNAKGFPRGSRWRVSAITQNVVTVKNAAGDEQALPLHQAKSFAVYEAQKLPLAKGDKVMVTHNGFDAYKKRLNNGQMLDVIGVTKKGQIKLAAPDGKTHYTLPHDYGHLKHAYCITSHASQGKTVDAVFIYQPAAAFPATDAKQFYVSVSRGRDHARIYTDNKTELLTHASDLGDRTSAIELVEKRNRHLEHIQQRQREEQNRRRNKNHNRNDYEYE
ncbi:MAG: relaxase domain-containing protein [Bacteroidia bacterium]|nr:relaxase domain-containing protein [Bacteroidia bacterium]